MKFFLISILSLFFISHSFAQKDVRQDILINEGWTVEINSGRSPFDELRLNSDPDPTPITIPHNLDAYQGYRRLVHGNLHGDAWYDRQLKIGKPEKGKRYFLFFEGVGSYATVFVNNKIAGKHEGGRTTFTIDITDYLRPSASFNNITVQVSHPANIKDLPWVCGGCSDERGFSEGSQPFGIFRPVHLIITNEVRITPFGIHAWADLKKDRADLFIDATVKNYSNQKRNILIEHKLLKRDGTILAYYRDKQSVNAHDSVTFSGSGVIGLKSIIRWTTDNPYLYKIVSIIRENGKAIDSTETDFGFRTINWKTPSHQFLLNDQPVFINGIAEYEHLLGQSHAFSDEQIRSRIKWIQFAGFNALRDGHQPHNLLYGKLCNENGILWWTQFSAHVWYDSPAFRENFKQLLKEWVIERRNDPSVVLWGLQNESKLPEDFAKECTELIRSLDPTASSQRLVTTCNGGSGTDWDVPQNWTGTYGGNPDTYASDIKKQILIGEYGAWRTLDLHTEGGFQQNGPLSEDRMVQLMEQKIRLAESVKDSCAGQFHWLLTSHDNPGRVQGGEGLRELDRIGPVNYKGLLTPWEEPTDAFYMFRSNYVSKYKAPMVYIASHTWPNRWVSPGIKDSIFIYSNCDEVELFNDNISLGRRKRNGIGTHFQWDHVNIQYNTLRAIGYVDGKDVAEDRLLLQHLPMAPHFSKLIQQAANQTSPEEGYYYLYRLNCGGPQYTDYNKNVWAEDRGASRSWTNDFKDIPEYFASQRRTFSPIYNSVDWALFQDFRYGREKLQFVFPYESDDADYLPLPDGDYLIELYFIEPWLGVTGKMYAEGMRLFDVAVNGKTVLKDVDIWSKEGTNRVYKRMVETTITGGKIIISFPRVKAGQAIIAAIAIASKKKITTFWPKDKGDDLCYHYVRKSWLDIGDKQFVSTIPDKNFDPNGIEFHSLPSALYGADWYCLWEKSGYDVCLTTKEPTDIYVASLATAAKPAVIKDFENTGTEVVTTENGGTHYAVYKRRYEANVYLRLELKDPAIVMLQPANNMQPAYDLKPVTPYRTNVAIAADGTKKESVNGRECVVVKSGRKAVIEWPVQTGVADIYSITMKYNWAKEQTIKGKIQLIGAGNTMMREEEVQFTFTREGKWNQFTINTGNMINAGNYTVRLLIDNAEGLAVSGIEVQ